MDEKSEALKTDIHTDLQKPRKCRLKCALPIVSSLLAVIALLATAGLWYQNIQTHKVLQATQQSLQQTIDAQEATLGQINRNQLKTQTTIAQLSESMGYNQQNWQRAEAAYLVKLANYQLRFNDNASLATRLLEDANDQLKLFTDSTTINFRQLLQDNITKLKNLTPIDTAGTIIRLNTISNQITRLSVIPSYTPQTTQISADTSKPLWQRILSHITHALKSLVIIQKNEQPISALASPLEQSYATVSIQWQLSLAQWAILKQQNDVYQQSLERAISLIQQKFAPNTLSQNLMNELRQLKDIPIIQTLPNLDQLIAASEELTKVHNTSSTIPANKVAPEKSRQPTIEGSISS